MYYILISYVLFQPAFHTLAYYINCLCNLRSVVTNQNLTFLIYFYFTDLLLMLKELAFAKIKTFENH